MNLIKTEMTDIYKSVLHIGTQQANQCYTRHLGQMRSHRGNNNGRKKCDKWEKSCSIKVLRKSLKIEHKCLLGCMIMV